MHQRSTSDYDPFARASILDAHEHDGRLRERAPAVHLSHYDVWAITRFADVQAAQKDWRTFTSTRRPFFDRDAETIRPDILVTQDPPQHTRTRRVLSRVLSPPTLRQMRSVFETTADTLLDRLLLHDETSLDAHLDIAAPFVLKVFPDALGLPEAGREHLLRFGDAAFNAFGPRNEIYRRGMQRAAPAVAWVDANTNRQAIRPGSLSAKVFDAVDDGELTETEAELLVRTLFAAGSESTIAALGSMIRAFAEHPDQWRALKDEPSLAPNALEETLRYESPLRFSGRATTSTTSIDGVRIPAGARVMLMMLSAGRDPRRWPDPDRFDIRRKTGGHVNLGTGIHACVGQALVRIEGNSLLSALIRRVDELELTGRPQRAVNFMARGHEHIPVLLRRAAAPVPNERREAPNAVDP